MSLCQGEELRRYLDEAIGRDVPAVATFIGKVKDGQPVSVISFSDWRVYDVEIHLWSSGTLTRDFLRRVAQYAFDELHVTYVRCKAAADEPGWVNTIRRMGFVQEGIERGGLDGQIDMICFSIRKEEFIL